MPVPKVSVLEKVDCTTQWFLNFNGDQTRISTIGSKVINVLYNTINKTTGKYYSGDFTKTVTLFKN